MNQIDFSPRHRLPYAIQKPITSILDIDMLFMIWVVHNLKPNAIIKFWIIWKEEKAASNE